MSESKSTSSSVRSRAMMAAVMVGAALSAGSATATSSSTPDARIADAQSGVVDDITRYCQTCWRNARLPADRWSDCTQQVFVRLLERVDLNRWHEMLCMENTDKREFLRAIDAVKKRTQRAKRFANLSLDLADRRNHSSEVVRDQWEAVHDAASELLSPRQQKIVELSATGWAVPEIAVELGTTPERVSDEKYKAIVKLRSHLKADDA